MMKGLRAILRCRLKSALLGVSRLILEGWIRPLEDVLLGMVDHKPSGFRRARRQAVCWLKDCAWLGFTRFRAEALRWDGAEWCVILIHDGATHSKQELRRLLFTAPPVETVLERIFLWQVHSTVRRGIQQGCLVVCDLNRLMRLRIATRYAFRVPPWLRANLDVSAPLEEIARRMSRSARKRLAKLAAQGPVLSEACPEPCPERSRRGSRRVEGYTYEFSRRPDDFDAFYHKMYVPYVTRRYGERAIVGERDGKRALFEQGGLLLVKRDGRPVAGELVHRRGQALISVCVGIGEDGIPLSQHRSFDALDAHLIHWARRHGLRSIDFGMTRARLTDGVFEHKRQLGNRFERDILTHTMWTFFGDDLPPALIRHLNDLAFIAEEGREYRWVVFDPVLSEAEGGGAETRLPDPELARRASIAAQAGLDGCLALTPIRFASPERNPRNCAGASSMLKREGDSATPLS